MYRRHYDSTTRQYLTPCDAHRLDNGEYLTACPGYFDRGGCEPSRYVPKGKRHGEWFDDQRFDEDDEKANRPRPWRPEKEVTIYKDGDKLVMLKKREGDMRGKTRGKTWGQFIENQYKERLKEKRKTIKEILYVSKRQNSNGVRSR